MEKSKEDWLERHLFQQKKQTLQTLQSATSQVPTDSEDGPAKSLAFGKGRGKGQSQGKGKGRCQGKGQNQGKGKGKGKGASETPSQPPRFSVTIYCKFCKKKGHYEDQF